MIKNYIDLSVNSLGKNLKLLRTSCDISQTYMAELLGLSRSAYVQYELGNRIPDVYILYEIARFFELEMEMLFETDRGKFLGEMSCNMADGGNDKKLMENYRQLSPFSKGRLFEFSEILIEQGKQKEKNLEILNERRKAK